MNIIILTAPAGAGKNTISEILAKKRERCAVIDFDVLRNMIRQPHKAPWEGEEGYKQNILHLNHACILAKKFAEEQFDVVILDVITNETAKLYKETLKDYKPKIILLFPTFEEIKRRNTTRPPRLTDQELKMVYSWQKKLTLYDEKIDNTNLNPEEVADKLIAYLM